MLRDVVRECKLRGLTLRGDAARAMKASLEKDPDATVESLIEAVRQRVERGKTCVVDAEVVRGALEEERPCLVVLDAYATPRLAYDPGSHKFSLVRGSTPSRSEAYRARYELARERVARCFPQICRLDAVSAPACVLGVVLEIESKFYLEDLHSVVRVEFGSATAYGGFFAEGMVVVVEGEVDGNVFRARAVGHPPPEPREAAFRAIGGVHLDVFGDARVATSVDAPPWIIAAETHLDAPTVLPRLRHLMEGLVAPASRRYKAAMDHAKSRGSREPPRIVVALVGNFLSSRLSGAAKLRELKARFADLAAMIASLEIDADFLLVPGPRDPCLGSATVLPRPKLPARVLQPFMDKIPTTTAATSPCRLRGPDGRELVIHRGNTLRKLRKLSSALVPATASEKFDLRPTDHLAKTLIDQAHLAPFSLNIQPVQSDFDHALRLYPPPNALALADDTAPRFDTVYENCAVFNPGNFAQDGAFVLYDPLTCKVDSSRVPPS
ncbi:hypothetical protein CTAYLR_002824 [Chrysophaeum taylorii]|uniref:DNA polymerase epsilon subunit n=1 Tax=Chrysophaeum taylorii TaxID=2483200 RepID=A0AAD7U815_9STRA|nr:hypothetical protein CTAYLR_002824 [Chrysophaeum taylorii]